MDELLRSSAISESLEREGRAATADAVRTVLDRLRKEIGEGIVDESRTQLAIDGIPEAVERELRRSLGYSLEKVINATCVILHTNLGRAPLSREAREHLVNVASS